MNPSNEREGRALIQAWKNASAAISIEFLSAQRDVFLKRQGRITAFDDSRVVLSLSDGSEFDADLVGSDFKRVGSRAKFAAMGLDPDRYQELVEISLDNMDRLTLAAARANVFRRIRRKIKRMVQAMMLRRKASDL